MFRKVNTVLNLYLCQSSDWQTVVESEDEESAATLAIQDVMKKTEENFSLSMVVAVIKLPNNIMDDEFDTESKLFYSPMILANAGFHVESKNLDEILKNQELETQDEE